MEPLHCQFSKLQHVLTKFQLLSLESSHIEGTGLGLSICAKLCTLLDGGIWCVINSPGVHKNRSMFQIALLLQAGGAQKIEVPAAKD